MERTFVLKWHDALAAAAGPALLHALRAEAPGVRLRFLAEASTDSHDPRRGDIDLEAGSSEPSSPEIRHEIVGHDRLVLALRPAHPLCDGPLILEDYAAAEHITVSRRGRLRDPIDDALQTMGVSRRVVAAAPTNATALQFLRHHDLVAAVPQLISRPVLDDLGLRTLPLPLDMPVIPIHLAWHQRYDNDPGCAGRPAPLCTRHATPPTTPLKTTPGSEAPTERGTPALGPTHPRSPAPLTNQQHDVAGRIRTGSGSHRPDAALTTNHRTGTQIYPRQVGFRSTGRARPARSGSGRGSEPPAPRPGLATCARPASGRGGGRRERGGCGARRGLPRSRRVP